MTEQARIAPQAPIRPFEDPDWTAKGERRATVSLNRLETLWFNTGTLCNIECVGCYIESSPTNDRLVYLTPAEVSACLDEAADLGVREVGFTGGEPFMNPGFTDMLRISLERGFDVLTLTNAMRPMMRTPVRRDLASLIDAHGERLTIRVSLDHYSAASHDDLRGAGAFAKSLTGMRWLRDAGARMTVAGRMLWRETEAEARAGFAAFFERESMAIDAHDPTACVLFPEMDASLPTPEITTDCWRILNKRPDQVMCASSRMIVKRRGAAAPSVVACTLLPYDPAFDLGPRISDAAGPVALTHPHCSRFCVLGGASCSA